MKSSAALRVESLLLSEVCHAAGDSSVSSVCLVLPGAGAGEPPSGRAALCSAGGAGGGTGGASGAGGGCRRSAGLPASPARGRVLQSAPRPRGAGEHADFCGEGQAGRTECSYELFPCCKSCSSSLENIK